MTEGESGVTDGMTPTEPPHQFIRAVARNIYGLVFVVLISGAMLTLAISILVDTAKNVRNGRELARDGRLTYTGDVDSTGKGQSTVIYSFTYDGQQYRGEMLLPLRYISQIPEYRKSGNFPVQFLPRDPSINHPNDWHDDQSYSSAFISYVLIAIVIVQWLAWGRFLVRDMRRNDSS